MSRRMVTQKINSTSEGDSATNGGHGIYNFATFGPIFRFRNESISEILPTHVVITYLIFFFAKVLIILRRETRKLYVPKNRVPWLEIFDCLIGKPTFPLELKHPTFCLDISFPNTSVYVSGAAGGRSLRVRVLLLEGIWLVEWLHRRLIASHVAIQQTTAAMGSIRLRHSDRFFDVEMNPFQKFPLPMLQ